MKSTIGFPAMTLAAAGLLLAPVTAAQTPAPFGAVDNQARPASAGSRRYFREEARRRRQGSQERVHHAGQLRAEAWSRRRPTRRPSLPSEASDAMAKAVKDEGLSVEEYTSIIEVEQNDPVVRNKLLQRLKSAASAAGPF